MSEDNKNTENTPQALIYCRVSSSKQRLEGSGLESQEQRCRAYADEKGYDVEAVFPDDVSGGGDFMRRPCALPSPTMRKMSCRSSSRRLNSRLKAFWIAWSMRRAHRSFAPMRHVSRSWNGRSLSLLSESRKPYRRRDG
ncbi:recombinase family protein [Rhodobacteraceae bacterium G21628-S1]|nr:recombinase family protein [Rhodobacteraceae bacterium G21628-S1]